MSLAKAVNVLRQEGLPRFFTLRQFHAVAHELYQCCESTSKGMLTQLNETKMVSIVRPERGSLPTLYKG
jgi:hypothetical protein